MRSTMRLLSLAAVVAVAGCSVKEAPKEADSAAAPVASAAAAPNVVNIVATDYKFDAPDSIPAGLTTFRMTDSGKELHHATLIRLDSGKTAADFATGLKTMKPGTPSGVGCSGRRPQRRSSGQHVRAYCRGRARQLRARLLHPRWKGSSALRAWHG